MTCAALVLFMTLPGLALFYGGLVRTKNVLSVMAQCLGMSGMVTIFWVVIGYSFCFSPGSPFLGGTKFAMLAGVDAMPNGDYSAWVSLNVFAMYQLMFAIITPGLIVGAIAERMKYSAMLLFMAVWMFVVYFPLAHMVWGVDGFMNGVWNANASIKAIDFAGGTVVHMSSGWSAIVLALIVGKRKGFGKESFAPHSLVLTIGRHGHAVGRLVRLQRGQRGGGRLDRSQRVHDHDHRSSGSVRGVARGRVAHPRQAHGARLLLRAAVGGLVVITPAARLRHPRWRADHRCSWPVWCRTWRAPS